MAIPDPSSVRTRAGAERVFDYLPGSDAAAAAVDAAIQPGDVVLVKGSRGTRCDVAVDRLVRERG